MRLFRLTPQRTMPEDTECGRVFAQVIRQIDRTLNHIEEAKDPQMVKLCVGMARSSLVFGASYLGQPDLVTGHPARSKETP